MNKRYVNIPEEVRCDSLAQLIELLQADPIIDIELFGRDGKYSVEDLWQEICHKELKLIWVRETDAQGTETTRIATLRHSARAIINAEGGTYVLQEVARWKERQEERLFFIFRRYDKLYQRHEHAISGTRRQLGETLEDAILREIAEELHVNVSHADISKRDLEGLEKPRRSRYYPNLMSIVLSVRFYFSFAHRPIIGDPIFRDGDKLIFLKWEWAGLGEEPDLAKLKRVFFSQLIWIRVFCREIIALPKFAKNSPAPFRGTSGTSEIF